MRIKVQDKFGDDEFYINPIYFSMAKDIVKNTKRIDSFYSKFIKMYNKTARLSSYYNLIDKLMEKLYYEKYFKSFAIVFFKGNEEYCLLCKNEQERDEKFNQLIKNEEDEVIFKDLTFKRQYKIIKELNGYGDYND